MCRSAIESSENFVVFLIQFLFSLAQFSNEMINNTLTEIWFNNSTSNFTYNNDIIWPRANTRDKNIKKHNKQFHFDLAESVARHLRKLIFHYYPWTTTLFFLLHKLLRIFTLPHPLNKWDEEDLRKMKVEEFNYVNWARGRCERGKKSFPGHEDPQTPFIFIAPRIIGR